MKRVPWALGVVMCSLIYPCSVSGQGKNGSPVVGLQFDGARSFQSIDGFGVNVNTRSWNGRELEPALDLLLDSLHATIWRVVVETVEKWEEVNDNNDPFSFNWDYYNKLYKTPKFQKAFETIRYLNQRGITKQLMINFMGWLPLWMGGEVVKPEYEDEYIEMLVSFFYYARFTEHLQFGLVSPMNEPDMRKEGPTVGPEQYVRLVKKLMARMQTLGLGDVRYVLPDVASMNKGIDEYLPVLERDSLLMSKTAHLGLHSYGGYYADVNGFIQQSAYPASGYWITEWNSWRDGLDDGKIGVYDYAFARECIYKLLQLLQHGASAGIAWEGYDSYYEHHAPSLFSYWGILGYDPNSKTYTPRKHFYAIAQIARFVLPGSRRIAVSRGGDSFNEGDSLIIVAFQDTLSHKVTIVGVNSAGSPMSLSGGLTNLPDIDHLEMFHTDRTEDLHRDGEVKIDRKAFKVMIPPDCIFTLSGKERKPEPPGWYAGDIHVHLNCGDGTALFSADSLASMMKPNDLAVISLLADMGNGEVKDSKRDLPKVDGKDARQSIPGRIIHWDTEWHWDATYSSFNHQALGGHLVLLGLKEARQIWDESAYKILDWSRKQNAISGFAHMEYLNDSIQQDLNCCIPIDYPVEAALGTIDFVSEDVYGTISPNNGTYYSEGGLQAYYRLLNCGFRPGLAAGTDFPCNYNEPLGTLLTYVNVKDGPLTYRRWIEGIKGGRTVVSRNGHHEFLDMMINGKYGPGDVINIKKKDSVQITVSWTDDQETNGRIELICNGKIVAVQPGMSRPGSPLILTVAREFVQSGWICARRMGEKGHVSHTGAIYMIVDKKPVRASAADAQYFIDWIDNIVKNMAPGGKWNVYYSHDQTIVRDRYLKARDMYSRILRQTAKQ